MIGIILAGGAASRIGGGDKGDRLVGGRTILDHVAGAMRAQCAAFVINASGDGRRFASYGASVVPDDVPGRPRPLARVHARRALVARLGEVGTATGAAIVCARSGGCPHHVTALWSVALRHDLRHALSVDGVRRVRRFVERHGAAYADWPVEPYDPFTNINTPDDLREAERVARLIGQGAKT